MINRGEPQWYRDAIIYQLHVKSFFDSDNDGIGDFQGLTRKLDYVKELGATAIWLMPFYPSPLKDDGSIAAVDLLHGYHFMLHGKTHRIALDPAERSVIIWRLVPPSAETAP